MVSVMHALVFANLRQMLFVVCMCVGVCVCGCMCESILFGVYCGENVLMFVYCLLQVCPSLTSVLTMLR